MKKDREDSKVLYGEEGPGSCCHPCWLGSEEFSPYRTYILYNGGACDVTTLLFGQ
jgi:hypothetical protein